MIRPYYNLDDDRGGRYQWGSPGPRFGSPFTPAVKGIIIACVAIFLVQMMLLGRSGRTYGAFIEWFGYTPMLAFAKGRVWQLVTYIFLHGGAWHIFFNLFFLWMIGGRVEEALGTKRFLWLFFLAGVSGALVQGIVFPRATTIGASGSVMGVAAACAMLFPNMTVLVFFILPMKMKHFVILLAVIDMMAASGAGDNVAHFAHLAGLGAGYLFVKYEPRVGPVFTRLYYRLTGRYRGFAKGGGSVRIDDDDDYRKEVDRILDKIFQEGTGSLSKEENEFLKKTSDRYKKE